MAKQVKDPWQVLDLAIKNDGILYILAKDKGGYVDLYTYRRDAAVDIMMWSDACALLMWLVREGPLYELRADVGETHSVSVVRDEGDVMIAIVYGKGHAIVKSIKRIARRACMQINRWVKREKELKKQQENNPMGAGHSGLVN